VDPGVGLINPAVLQEHDQEAFDPLEVFYNQFPNCNIRHALQPVLDPQAGQLYNLPPATVFRVADRVQLLPEGITIPEKCQIPIPPSLYLLAGHSLLGIWETTFTIGCENSAGLAGL
jgi:hypothetical protein